MSGKMGLGHLETLFENLKRELSLGGSTLVGLLEQTTAITGAGGSTTLTVADSGTVFLVNAADGTHTFTLPALTDGFNCEIIVTVASDNDIDITAPGDNMIISCRSFSGSGAAQQHLVDTCTTLKINADSVAAPVGTRVKIYCDGTNYVAIGSSDSQGSQIFASS